MSFVRARIHANIRLISSSGNSAEKFEQKRGNIQRGGCHEVTTIILIPSAKQTENKSIDISII